MAAVVNQWMQELRVGAGEQGKVGRVEPVALAPATVDQGDITWVGDKDNSTAVTDVNSYG